MTNETNLVNIGVKIDEASVKATAESVIAILNASADNRTNDEVTLKALDILKAQTLLL